MQSSADYCMTALWSQPSMADSTTSGQGCDSWNTLVVSSLMSSSIQKVYRSAAQGSKKTSCLIIEVTHHLPWIFVRLREILDGKLAHLGMGIEVHGNMQQRILDNKHGPGHRWYSFICISSWCRAFNSALDVVHDCEARSGYELPSQPDSTFTSYDQRSWYCMHRHLAKVGPKAVSSSILWSDYPQSEVNHAQRWRNRVEPL